MQTSKSAVVFGNFGLPLIKEDSGSARPSISSVQQNPKQGRPLEEESGLARFVFRKYCGNNQFIPRENIKFMLRDIYGFSHQHLEELEKEKATNDFMRIADFDKDGKISLADIETLVNCTLNDNQQAKLFTKTNAIRKENYNAMMESMYKTFDQFQPSTYGVAKDVFSVYDVENTGYIDKQDLPLVLADIARMLGQSPEMDRDLLMSRIENFQFRSKGKISVKEFEYLYQMRFDL